MQQTEYTLPLKRRKGDCIAIILLLCTLGGLCRATAQPAQDGGITLSFSGVSLVTVFDHIQKQSRFRVLYNSDLVKSVGTVNISVKGVTITAAMKECLAGKPLKYSIEDNSVIVSYDPQKVSLAGEKEITSTVTGRVISEATKLPLVGATVVWKGTNTGTITDATGTFNINRIKDLDTLLVSYVGYVTKEINVGNRETISVRLSLNINALEAVVVNKGYYTTTKALNTGDVTTVTAEEIAKQPVGDPLAALIGRVPGLQVTQTTGLPGKRFMVRLRGQNSISSGNMPLYIVDGVPFYNGGSSLDNAGASSGALSSLLSVINPSDIETISVLKDADATAIYGPRGANGVILITTKKGKAGKTRVSINVHSGIGHVTRMIPLLNTRQYLEMRREAFKNDGVAGYPTNAYDINGTWDTTRYTDWEKLLIGNTSHYTDAQASVSGGNVQTQFLVGVGYHKETTIYPGDFSDKRGSVHLNLSHSSLNQKFRLKFSMLYSTDVNILPLKDGFNDFLLPPDAPSIYDTSGNLNWENSTWVNPYRNLYATGSTNTDYLNSNLTLGYELIKGLKIKASLGYTMTNHEQINLIHSTYFDPAQTGNESSAEFGNNELKSWNIEPQLTYTKQLGASRLEAIMGMSFFQQSQKGSVVKGTGYSSDALLHNLQAANSISINSSTYSLYRFVSLFGRFGYSYEDKYIINLTGRRDGSTRFGPGRQYGNFGAIGAAWIFSREDWFQNAVPFVSFGKWRVSYGLTGNDQIGDYSYLDIYKPYYYTYQGKSTLIPVRFLNRDYAWEKNKKFEVGLELGLLKGRIDFTASWYSNLSGNQLLYYPLPNMTGFGNILENLPAKVRNSGLEFTLELHNVETKSFVWTTNINLTVPIDQAKLLSYPNLATSNYANSYIIGKSLFISKKLAYLGVDPETGIYTYRDYNKNGTIDYRDDYRKIVFTGQQWYSGMGNSFQYKNIELSFFLQYVRQNHAVSLFRYINGRLPGSMNNMPNYILGRWQRPGDKADIQQFSNANPIVRTAYFNMSSSDGSYDNGSFLRMKNLSVSYRLPENALKIKGFPDLKIYLQTQNLFTITQFKGADPENFASISAPPPLRVITVGMQAIF